MKMLKILIYLAISCWLSACSGMKSASDQADEKQKIATAKINTQLGIAYLEQHNIQRAQQKLLLALQQAPNIPETWYSMAYFLEVTGNKEQAKKDYLKAIELAPNRGAAQNNYGTFLCRSGEYRDSIQHFLLAVKDLQYINTADAYENAGLCALKIPDPKQAAYYFQQALAHDPNHLVSKSELAKLT